MKSRLSGLNMGEKKQEMIEGLKEDFERGLRETLDLVVWNRSNASEFQTWSKILNEKFLTKIEAHQNQNDVLNRVDLKALENKVITNLETNFESFAETTVSEMVAGIKERNSQKIKNNAAKLSSMFCIDMEDVLNPGELNIAAGIMMGMI